MDGARKTPSDVTAFEREQLRFFLSKGDVGATLTEINPSLAWLPVLFDLKLIDRTTQLAAWIEKNFADPDAVRDVAANIHFFTPETADLLEFRLQQTAGLPKLLADSWWLIIRHMRTYRRGLLGSEWFDIEARIKRGEHSRDLLERLASILRPKLRVGKRLFWDEHSTVEPPKRPSDLMSIEYEIEEGTTDAEVVAAWPKDAAAEVDELLLELLTNALSAALADATEVGVESELGFSASDWDVPSVAEHPQNSLWTGFLPIVRVAADVWTRLAEKDPSRALAVLDRWRGSPYHLLHRLALFAAADKAVPPARAAEVLANLSTTDLFVTNATVEAWRLISKRWMDFPPAQQSEIERRIAEGPPSSVFVKDQDELVDRCRFDLLSQMVQHGIILGETARAVFDAIRARQPEWQPRPAERAGFHSWTESSSGTVGDPATLDDVPDAELVEAAKRLSKETHFRDTDSWRALCIADNPRALRGLAAEAKKGQWPHWAWRDFLWAEPKVQDSAVPVPLDADRVAQVSSLLLAYPDEQFRELAGEASWWLRHGGKTLPVEHLWPLWDRIAEASINAEDDSVPDDAFTASLNHPAGRLAEVLLEKVPKRAKGSPELAADLKPRFERLTAAKGKFGFLARIRLAQAISFLFDRAPEWTKEHVLPLFAWTSPYATAAWSARRYATYIGSPQLFALTKEPFLELFARPGVSAENIRTYSDWLVLVLIANQSSGANYPITPTEARSALRRAGVNGLLSVGHRLAIEMEHAPAGAKLDKWRKVLGPVFQSIWPIDVELQSSASTFKLVQILRASGAAFPEAADVIIPFIRPEDPNRHTSIYAISDADDGLYAASPDKMLDLIAAVVGDGSAGSPRSLDKALARVREHKPALTETRPFQRLISIASPR